LKIAFIINSLVASKKKVESLFSSFSTSELFLSFYATEYAGHSTDLAKQVMKNEVDWIVSVGGDGTLNEILNGLMIDHLDDKSLPRLAMFPVGTGNDFSLSIKTTKDPAEFINALRKGQTIKIDIGKIVSPTEGTKHFINIADAGLGGDVTQRIRTSGNVIGKWVYYKSILLSLFTYKRPTLKIISAQGESTQKVITVIIANGISFGGGYKVGYDAKLNDGTFFIAIVGDISILTYLMKIPALMRGDKINHPKVHYFHAKNISLDNISDNPCYLEMDGEPSFSCPVSISCLPSKIEFLKLD
jgi:YegS/Rv2252/BmrU family lipid kinase